MSLTIVDTTDHMHNYCKLYQLLTYLPEMNTSISEIVLNMKGIAITGDGIDALRAEVELDKKQ